MSDLAERATRAATTVSWAPGLSPLHTARRIQDAALRVIDARVLQRLELIDREFDRTSAELERAGAAAHASAPRVRRVTPFPDIFGMFAAGFGAGLSIGAGRVVSRTPAGEMAVVGPSVLVLGVAAILLVIVGEVFARREKSTSTNRAIFLWFTTFLALVAIVGVSVRLAIEEFTVYGVAAVVVMVIAFVLALVFAIGATRRRQADDSEHAPLVRPGSRERNELLSASESAQDRAHDELKTLDDAARDAFAQAYSAGLAAVADRDVPPRTTVKRLRTLEWAAARYDLAG